MFVGQFDIDVKGALDSLQKLDQSFDKTVSGMSKLVGGLAGGFMGLEALHKFEEGLANIADLSDKLYGLHNSSGQSVHDILLLQSALKLAGGDAESVQSIMLKLQQAISGVNEEGKSTAAAFKALGLNQQDLVGKGALEQVEMLQKAFAKIGSQEDKAAIAGDLFGKRQAGSALTLLNDPEAMGKAQKQSGPLADIMDRNSGNFHEMSDAISAVGTDVQTFFASALEQLAPEITHMAEQLGKIDWADLGKGIGSFSAWLLKICDSTALTIAALNKFAHYIGLSADKDPVAHTSLAAHAAFLGDLAPLHSAEAHVGALQRIGRGGGFSIGAGDPMLSEAQRHTNLLVSMDANLRTLAGQSGGGYGHIPGLPI